MKKIHLICNAHLDPVWLWEWEEGAAEAISTFRIAADFCEQYEGFVFNHNEVILYKWVEEYEPELFKRIQKLVNEKKWNIMGGWYLQPDCNMPSGESFVRQILLGREYFKEKFGATPTTAINFDPFGHTRGLVQIMKKSGYDSYLFCRPDDKFIKLPAEDFKWIGYDGSEVIGHRSLEWYNSGKGKAAEKVLDWIDKNACNDEELVLWGIGNHGGGPSRIDLDNLKELMGSENRYNIIHSTPEQYFSDLRKNGREIPRHEGDLNSWAPGCYTSQIRIKQKHRLLENEFYMLEKMISSAVMQGLMEYPQKELHEIQCDLAMSEFHDILPGSSIQPVEENSIRLMDHALETISRLKARAFFALSRGQDKGTEDEIPILIYNPHPYEVEGIFECEFQPANQNWEDTFSMPVIYQDENRLSSQAEKECSNLNLDWRKHAVFSARLKPSSMNRFYCKFEILSQRPKPELKGENGKIHFVTEEMDVVINCETGLIDKLCINGVDYLKKNAFLPIVIEDNEDPWATRTQSFRNIAGTFRLMNREEGTMFSGVRQKLIDSVRVIEDGEVRTVIEAVFKYGSSFICQRYKLPKEGTEMQLEVRVHWNEKNKMLKMSVPTIFEDGSYYGQVAYGADELPSTGREVVAQKWTCVLDRKSSLGFTCINDSVYGSDYKDGEMRISLMRSSAYSALPIGDREIIPQDRYSERIDQGERIFKFWFKGGSLNERIQKIDREALIHNEKPYALSFYPSGDGKKPEKLVVLSDEVVQMTAFKKAQDGNGYIIRLFEPTGCGRKTTVEIPYLGIKEEVSFDKFEIKTYRINEIDKRFCETGLMEGI